ncbi:MAG TPA: CPBP family glutamic-type intramembrane protease [Chitinophagaceae bacterium]|nr:CPBP family glutamic-type intramembrane protease [Chitinophagaceae bacterium]
MRAILGYIRSYAKEVNKPILIFCTLFMAGFIWMNYHEKLEIYLTSKMNLPWGDFTGHVLIFLTAFIIPHSLLYIRRAAKGPVSPGFIACLLLAPMIFALKMAMNTHLDFNGAIEWKSYWNDIVYWPLRMITLFGILLVCRQVFHRHEPLYGLTAKKLNYTPYLIMLLIMVPLIAAASTQADFLSVYPKMRMILPLPEDAHPGWWYKLLFELSYGSDFFSIELFFRGFVVIGFIKWVGKDAILPMACFYCTIHFGKPLGECVSSYFGGLLLGIVSYHTRSIYGGLMVHLGIAWMMELGGTIGHYFEW